MTDDPFFTPYAGLAELQIMGVQMKMFVQNANDHIQRYYRNGSYYEIEELQMISRHFSPEGIVLDVGANVGNFSIFMAKAYPAIQIIPLEANSRAIEILLANIGVNELGPRFDTRHLGLGLAAAEGRFDLQYNPQNLGGARLIRSDEGRIRTVSGDSLFADVDNVTYIKIDVEGMELEVLQGLSETIQKNKPNLFVEVLDRHKGRFEEVMSKNNYRIVDSFKRYNPLTNYIALPN